MIKLSNTIKKQMATLLSCAIVWTSLTLPGHAALGENGLLPGSAMQRGGAGVTASGSEADMASDSDTEWGDELFDNLATDADMSLSRAATGDLWEHWTATDFKFLDGTHGKGTRQQPYQIQNKAHLRALSQLASLGMLIAEGALESDAYVGDYAGAYFELTGDINLGGMDWLPIGFYQNQAEMTGMVPHPFRGHFDGNGYTISNYRIMKPEWNCTGLFGAVKDSTISNLTVRISDTLNAANHAGILAGYVQGQSAIRNCFVKGNVRGRGIVGGITGYFAGSGRDSAVIEDCKADVTLDSVNAESGRPISVGGITGQADRVTIVDCEVETAHNAGARIQGKGYVGGITGWQNDADLYNVFVASGTIGGSGSTAIGGITGHYTSGDIKVARMNGTIGSSGLGNYAHEGTFIGNKGSGCNFTYGTEKEDDMAYLFTDTEAKLNAGVCGSDVPDDNAYTYDAHVGFWHSGDRFFTLKQGNRTTSCTERYFYEELEQGILYILDREINGGNIPYTINHIAPDSTGRPKRGYLVSIPQIDTVANGRYFYDVAVLTVSGSSTYDRLLDKNRRGAIAAGTTVTIATSSKNTNTEKYQLSGKPFYVRNGMELQASYVTGGQYTFTMPANDTEVSAVYKRVAADIRVTPVEYTFQVVQTRTGNRKSPTLTTVVAGNNGNEIARYVNGNLTSAQVMPVTIGKIVDANDDVADSRVLWSVDDSRLLRLMENDDADAAGYTDKSASIQVRLDSPFFMDIIRSLEKKQADNGYRYAIPATIYGAGYAGGGVAILTAATRNSESFEGKPCTAQSRIKVTFQILDQTYVDVEDVTLDKNMLEYTVTRTLIGNRKSPQETITVTPPQSLTATFTPDFFSRKDVNWVVLDEEVARVFTEPEAYRSAGVAAISDAKWIRDIIETDRAIKAENPYQTVTGNGMRETRVTAKGDDKNGNSAETFCVIQVRFVTIDRTGGSTGSGGSGTSGSGGGGASGSGSSVTPVGTGKGSTAPVGAIIGTWVQNAADKWMFSTERTYAAEWAYIHNPYAPAGQAAADWFYFDKDGYMVTGWFTDEAGNTFFLDEQADGTRGRMLTGWNWITDSDGVKRCYYFNTFVEGVCGKLMKNAATPDGFLVNEQGAWIIDGAVQTG